MSGLFMTAHFQFFRGVIKYTAAVNCYNEPSPLYLILIYRCRTLQCLVKSGAKTSQGMLAWLYLFAAKFADKFGLQLQAKDQDEIYCVTIGNKRRSFTQKT